MKNWIRKWILTWPWVRDLEMEAHQKGWYAGREQMLVWTGWKRWDWDNPTPGSKVQIMRPGWNEPDEWDT